jgi:hypothetical protein
MKSDLDLPPIDDSVVGVTSRHVTTLLTITTPLSTFGTSHHALGHCVVRLVDAVDVVVGHFIANIFLRLID